MIAGPEEMLLGQALAAIGHAEQQLARPGVHNVIETAGKLEEARDRLARLCHLMLNRPRRFDGEAAVTLVRKVDEARARLCGVAALLAGTASFYAGWMERVAAESGYARDGSSVDLAAARIAPAGIHVGIQA